VLLDEKVARIHKVRANNPDRDPSKFCVYVGMTGLDPATRFKKHKAGYKASRYVKKYGIRLMPELYAELNPLTYDEAVIAEQGLARRLRAEGYTVVGGH
jgi:predicted GIY-YIG superfamily endonuclease